MNTVGTTTSVPPSPTPPVNPAKGNKRGQTTLAAEIDRWEALADNLAPQIDQVPGLKEPFTQFQTLLAQAKAVRNQINTLRANADAALTQRNQLLVDGGDLFSRLHLGLQSVHGPRSPRLREFGLKPRKPRSGRPRKTPAPTTTTTPPPVEVSAHPPAAEPPAVAAVAGIPVTAAGIPATAVPAIAASPGQ
ncbi:MAG TPA: hypothetical protein VFE33_25655 [Thermoanaerobaculia bacterium]|nr:hypothetical protein [Thermoanaerobaculia bacterium]